MEGGTSSTKGNGQARSQERPCSSGADIEVLEKDVRHVRVVMLAGVDDRHTFLRSSPERSDTSLDLLSRIPHGHAQLVARLKVDPDLGRDAEVPAQSQRRIRRNGPLAIDDLADPPRRHVDVPGQLFYS